MDISDFATIDTGSIDSSLSAVTGTDNPAVYQVDIALTGVEGTVTLRLSDDDSVTDGIGNVLGGAGIVGAPTGDGSAESSPMMLGAASVSGKIWFDGSADAYQDTGEGGRAGVVVYADINLNGVFDASEPWTTSIDETGFYTLTGLPRDTSVSIRIDAPQYEQTHPVSFAVDDGTLTFRDVVIDSGSSHAGLYGVKQISLSPDGRHLYAITHAGDVLTVYQRDPVTDAFARVSAIRSSTPGFADLQSPNAFKLDSTGRFGYLISSHLIYAVRRDATSGEITFIEQYENSPVYRNDLFVISSIDISPDGRYLYVLGQTSDSLSVYQIDPATGRLQLQQRLDQDIDLSSGLDYGTIVKATPDGTQLAVFSSQDRDLTFFDVTPGSGILVAGQQIDNPPYPYHFGFSPDSKFLYAGSRYSANLQTYSRDGSTGQWSLVGDVTHAISSTSDLKLSGDGRFVYVTDESGDQVHQFDRDVTTGELTLAQTLSDIAPHDRLDRAVSIAISPNGQELWVGAKGDHAASRFDRVSGSSTATSHVIDTTFQAATGFDFGIYAAPSLVTQFAPVVSAPTSATVVDFSLTFDKAVSGVDPTDFQVDAPDLTGTSIQSVSGGPTNFTISVNTGQGQGDLSVLLIDDDTIVDALGASFGGTGDNGSVASAPPLLVDRLAPLVNAIALPMNNDPSAGQVTFTVTFSEAVSGVDSSDFSLATTDVTGASITSVNTIDSDEYSVVVDTGNGDGTLVLKVVDDDSIIDAFLNPLGDTGIGNGNAESAPYVVLKSGRISGRMVIDADQDGYADAGESGLAGAIVFVDLNDNGQQDSGEPSSMTLPDDVATTDTDETGSYEIQGVPAGSHAVVVVPPPGWALTNPAGRADPIGATTFVQRIRDGSSGANWLDEAAGVTESPDGNFLYVASYNDDSVTVFSRNASTGLLTVVQQVVNNSGGVTGLFGAQSIAISPDGNHLYVAAALDDALVMFERDQATGQLTFLGRLKDGIGGVNGLNEAVGVQISDDGLHLYVAAFTDNSVALFTRDPATGLVTYTQAYGSSTNGAFAAELSPDQRHVYVSGANSSAITVWERDEATGMLSLKQTVRETDTPVSGISTVSGMSFSPDGNHLYAAGYSSNQIAVFGRDAVSGELTFIESIDDPNTSGSARPISVLVGPHGHHVVAMYETYDAITIYRRDAATGQLTTLQTFRDGFSGVDGLNGAWDAEFSADGRFLYVVGAYDDAVVTFKRRPGGWIATNAQADVAAAEETVVDGFAALNIPPAGLSIEYSGSLPVVENSIDVTIKFSEPVIGFDIADISLGGTISSASVTNLSGTDAQYVATISLGSEQGTVSLAVIDDGSIDDAFGLDLGGPAIGDGTFTSSTWDVDLQPPLVESIENTYTDTTSIRRLEFEVTFDEPVGGVDTADFQVISSGLSDVTIESVTGSGQSYIVVVTNTAGTGTIALNLVDNDTIRDAVDLPLGGPGLVNGDHSSAIYSVEPAVASGRIFHDRDDDGYQDASEPGIAGITVYLDENANAVRDAGEPFVVTSDDAAGTTDIDEAGQYSITTDQTGPVNIVIDIAGTQYLQTSPRQFSGGTGFLTHQQTITTDPLLAVVFGNYGVEVSPDGNFVVVQASDDGGGVAVFRQLPDATLQSLHWYPAGSFPGFEDPQGITFSPDGKYLYLYAKQSKSIHTYGFDAADGSLSLVNNLDLPANSISSFASLDIRISPDGKNLYATAYSESTLRVFGVDPVTGTVTLLQTFYDWGATPRLQNASGITISPDGRNVYVGSFAEYYINAFDRSPIDGTLTKIQELPDVRRPSRLLSSSDGQFIIVSAWDTFTGQDLITLRRDATTGLLSVESRRAMPATPEGASLSPDGSSLHYADDNYANLNTLTRDPVTGAFTALDVLTDDVDVLGMRGVDDTAVSPDGKYLYAANGFERNLHLFTRDQGTRSESAHQTSLGFGDQTEAFDFGIFNPSPTLVSATSDRSDPTNESTATITVEFSEPVTEFDRDDLSLTVETLAAFPSASIGTVSGGPAIYNVPLSGLSGDGQLELVLDDDDSVIDTLGEPLGGSGTETLPLVSFSVDNVPPLVSSWLPPAGTETTASTLAFTLTFDEPVENVDRTDFQLDAIGVTGASIIDVVGATDTYTIHVGTGTGDGSITLRLVDDDSITDVLGQPLGGAGPDNGASASPTIVITKTGTIEGTLFHDTNENGWQNQGEPGIVGVTVYLDLNDNGQLDSATEPSVITQADDPETLQYPEAGLYQFFAVPPGEYEVRVDSSVWNTFDRSDWDTVTSSTYSDLVNFSVNNKSLRISPDGQHLYVFDHLSDAIVVLAMPQTASEVLTEIQVLPDQFIDTTNASGDIAFSPDGAYLYMAEDNTESVVVYARNTSDGTLTRTQSVFVPDIGPYTLEVAPDGRHLYVGGGYIAPFTINASDGTLTSLAATGLPARVQDIVFSSDGTKLYAVDYGNVLMRVYSRDPVGGSITQIQATGSQTATTLGTVWSAEIAHNDRDVYVAAPLHDTIWNFRTLADGTLSYFSMVDLDTDGVRDIPMDVQLSPDGNILFVALGLDDAIQLLYRADDGSLTEGSIFGTKDPSITNIYQNSSSLMAVSALGDAVVRVNNRDRSIELYRAKQTDSVPATVASATVTNAHVAVYTSIPELESITTSATSPWTGDSVQYEVTFSETVTGVDTSDFGIVSSAIQGAVIESVIGSGTSYTIAVDLTSAYGQGDFAIELIDDDTIINDRNVPLAGYGASGSVGTSPAINVDLPAPTLISLVYENGTASELTLTATFSQDVSGVDVSDFDLEIIDAGLTGLSIASVSSGTNLYTVTIDLSSAAGQGDFFVFLKDDDTIINGRSIPYDGVGISPVTPSSDNILLDYEDPTAVTITASPSPLLDYADILFDVTFSEPVFNVDAADFALSQSGVVGTSIRSVAGLPDGRTFQVLVDSGSLDGSIQLLLVDNDTITDSTGRTLGGAGLGNGDLSSEFVPVERNPQRDIVGNVYVDGNDNGVRDPGEPGAPGGIVYVDYNLNDQRDAGEPSATTWDDDPGTAGTDETGSYKIPNIPLGQWQVRFEPDVRFLLGDHSSSAVTLEFESDEGIANLGVIANQTTVRGHVFDDLNQDGDLDPGELGLPGWTIFVDENLNGQLDAGERVQVTATDDPETPVDESGSYEFSPFLLSTGGIYHSIQLVARPDYFLTSPDSSSHRFLAPTDVHVSNFGVTPNLTRISGAVYDDVNADGIRSAGEPGLADWTVFLDENENGHWDGGEPTMQTLADDPATPGIDETGMFEFDTLNLGTHIVYATVPVEYLSTSPNPISISFAATTDTADVSFALATNDTTLSGVVWDDFDRDGVRDGGESGVAGATVYLDMNDNDHKDGSEPFRVTAADGGYEFLHVTPGDHVVRAILPRTHERTTPAQTRERVYLWHGNNLLREIDPLTGAEIKESSISATQVRALAFDGQWLWALDQGPAAQTYQTVLQIDPDSHAVVDVHTILADGTFVGLATVAGSVFAIETDNLRLYRLNGANGELDRIFDLQTINAGSPHLDGALALSGAAGESADGSSVLLETTAGRWLTLDPETALINGHFDYVTEISDGLSGSTGSLFVGDTSARQVRVYDELGNLLRTLNVNCGPGGMASGIYHDMAIRVSPILDQVIDDLNFSARYFGVDIAGVQFDDVNDNGTQDAGEPPLPGVTVFADRNDNGFPDSNEIQTVSAADGSYALTGLEPGTFTVRALSPQHYRPSSSYPSRHRLFGISDLHSEIANCQVLVLNEFDPVTGAVLGEFYVNQSNSFETSLTFDGQNLFLANNSSYEIAELAYNGTIVAEHGMPRALTGAPFSAFIDSSFVYVDGFLFAIGGDTANNLSLWQIDLFNNNNPDDISSADFDLLGSIEISGLPETSTVFTGRSSTVTTDGHSILLGTTGGGSPQRLLKIDPFTLTGTLVDDVAPTETEKGMARLGNELFVAYSIGGTTDGEIVVYDDAGSTLRTLNGFPSQKGLAGGLYRDNGVTFTLAERTSVADVHHSHHVEPASITGNVSRDSDVSGTIETGEPPLAGVTVYVDLNRNNQFDLDEPSAISDQNGDYTIAGLLPDRYVVRQVSPADLDGYAVAGQVTRLFTQGTDDGVSTLYEISPENDAQLGTVLNQFPSPGPVDTHAAITLYEGDLYLAKSNQLFRINPDTGEVLETIPITTGAKDAIEIRDGVAYMVNYGRHTIDQFDLVRRRVIARLDVNAINSIVGIPYINFTYGTAVDNEHFIVNMRSGIHKINFRTGLIVPHTPIHNYSWTAYMATAGGEYFRSSTQGPSLRTAVTSSTADYNIPGEISYRYVDSSIAGTVSDYGAELDLPTQHAVWVPLGETITGIDFGNQPTVGTVSGVQFEDTNGNGVLDAGESPLSGITVFIDGNANGLADAGEPQTLSAADGTYTIADVPQGEHIVQAESPTHFQPTIIDSLSNRLIGVLRVTNSESPTGYYLRLIEVDPVTGNRLAEVSTTIPVNLPYTAAFDGQRVIIVDNNLDVLLEVGLDGSLLDSVPLPGQNGSTVFSQGPAVIDGTTYLLTSGGGMPLQLMRYDADSNEFYGAMPISRFIDPARPFESLPQLTLSLSESPDGRSILAYSNVDSRVFVIDPLTARMTTMIDLPRTNGGVWSAAAVGGELFVRASGSQGNMDVYDSQYNLVRTLSNSATAGMGGAVFADSAIAVTVMTGQGTAGVNFGHRSTLTTLSGTVTDDLNKNRISDSSEPSSEGVRVYLDANRNGLFDTGEVSTLTDSAGNYSFGDLVPGDYSVRVDQPVSLKVLTSVDGVDLYSLEINQGVSTIRKHDPITGQLLREFPAPGSSTVVAGLALDANGLYYSANSTVWKLDPDGGQSLGSVQLPAGEYSGVAAIGGTAYTIDAASASLYKIDTSSMQVTQTLSLNVINQAHANAPFTFGGNLGENPNATRLMARLGSGGGTLVINPDTGIVEERLATNSGVAGLSGAGGENFRSQGENIRVELKFEEFVRNVPTAETVYGIGAAVVPSSEYIVRAAPDTDFAQLDFFQQVDGPTSIEGVFWDDVDKDGSIDAGERLLADRFVFLDDNQNGLLDTGERSTMTSSDDPATTGVDETGRYVFEDVQSGDHTVVQVLPTSWQPTYPFAPQFEIDLIANNGYVAGQSNGTNPYYDSSISADGAFVAFSTSLALLAEDTHGGSDVYVLETATDELELISVSSSEVISGGRSLHPVISADGRYVVFWSYADHFVADDNNATLDIFIRDRQLGTTTLISAADPAITTGSSTSNSYSYSPGFSDDGRYATFWSNSTDIVSGDTNGVFDLFLKDLQLGTIERINLAPGLQQAIGGNTHNSHVSDDGSFIAFWSRATNLVPGDTNGSADVFVLEKATGQIARANTTASGTQGNDDSTSMAISDDGRYVVFQSKATNLDFVSGQVGNQVFLKDTQTGELRMISKGLGGVAADLASVRPSISGDGRWVVFESFATNLIEGDDNGRADVFLYDTLRDQLTLLSRSIAGGGVANGRSDWIRISNDGSTVTFNSNATDLTSTPQTGGNLYSIKIDDVLTGTVSQSVSVAPGQIVAGIDFGSRYAPVAPADIVLSDSAINENTDTSAADVLFSQLSAADIDTPTGHTYELVAGVDDVDNAKFSIIDDQLFIRQGQLVDYETQPEYLIRLRATDTTGLTYEEAVRLDVTNLVEMAPIELNAESSQRSMINSLTIQFDDQINVDPGAFRVHNRDTGDDVELVIALDHAAGKTTAVLSFTGSYAETGGSLVDGNYQLSIDGSKIRSSANGTHVDVDHSGTGGGLYELGESETDGFFRLFGDSDGDRDVDGQDFGRFALTHQKTAGQPGFNSALDGDGDGDVDGQDYGRLVKRQMRRLNF